MLPLLVSGLLASVQLPLAIGSSAQCAETALSCQSGARVNPDPCCVPAPAGLFIFKQRFEPDVEVEGGKWGIEGLEVMNCDGTPATTTYAPRREHEEIASYCLRSALFGGEEGFNKAENEWAQSEVGEGVEEVWARSWNSAGRYISTLSPECSRPEAAGSEVPGFFRALSRLHERLPVHDILADADITPSEDTTYSLDLITESLASASSFSPIVICDNITLSSVYWPFLVHGAFQEAIFDNSTDYSLKSNCPEDGIIYKPAQILPKPTATGTWDELRRPTLRAITLSNDDSRLYYSSAAEPETTGLGDPRKLGLFKHGDEGREERKGRNAARTFVRDEL